MGTRRTSILGILILISIALMAMGGCGGGESSGTGTPISTETKTFSKYGFSFEYPKGLSIWQDGLLDDRANEDSGMVQVVSGEGSFPLFAVSWVKTWQWGLEGGLEAGFEGIENCDGIGNVVRGEIVETTKIGHHMLYQVGHRMLYQYYIATTETQGEMVYGIVGAFYCDNTQRAFGLVAMNKTTTTGSSEEALDDLADYLDSFVCH